MLISNLYTKVKKSESSGLKEKMPRRVVKLVLSFFHGLENSLFLFEVHCILLYMTGELRLRIADGPDCDLALGSVPELTKVFF